jgi:diguanylate cyclase (GGDEF)-like protein
VNADLALTQKMPALIAFLAAVGLLILTVGSVIGPAAGMNLWHIATMAAAWVAVLASVILARERVRTADGEGAVAEPAAAPTAVSAPETDTSGLLFEFARELHGTVQSDRLRLLIARLLPVILGRRDVWVVAQFDSRQQIIVPSAPGRTDPISFLSDEPRQWLTYPMKAEGRTVGLLGAAAQPGGLSPREHRLFDSVASLIAQALSTAHAFEAMREASLVDPLTGCAMRAEGLRRFEAELRRADRAHTSVAVLMLDLDYFKSINDRYGHRAGDEVLASVGETLLKTLRASDVRCRWGGEEFLLILPDSNVERARAASDKLRQRIADTPVRAGDHIVRVTASIGVTLTRHGEADVQQLIARADAALYHAKRMGRNRIRLVLGGTTPYDDSADARPAAAEGPHAAERASAEAHDANRSGPDWSGPERRDPARHDRRRFPGPGRRASDTEPLAGPWRAS